MPLAMRVRNAGKAVLKWVELFLNRVSFSTAFFEDMEGQGLL